MGLSAWRRDPKGSLAADVRALQAALQQPSPYPMFLRTPMRRRVLAVSCAALGVCLVVDLYGTYRLIAGRE